MKNKTSPSIEKFNLFLETITINDDNIKNKINWEEINKKRENLVFKLKKLNNVVILSNILKSDYEESTKNHKIEIKNLEEKISHKMNEFEIFIREKKEMNYELENLIKINNDLTIRYNKEKTDLKNKLDKEFSNYKENFENQEKNLRNAWMKSKKAKIKELTIKSLEPELKKIMEKHNMEILKLKGKYEEIISEKDNLIIELKRK